MPGDLQLDFTVQEMFFVANRSPIFLKLSSPTYVETNRQGGDPGNKLRSPEIEALPDGTLWDNSSRMKNVGINSVQNQGTSSSQLYADCEVLSQSCLIHFKNLDGRDAKR